MATIKELRTEINNYLFPNILDCKINGELEYQINGIWIDQMKENYFFNESLLLIQLIEDTVSKSDSPILIIQEIKVIFEKRMDELKAWKKMPIIEYLLKSHAVAISDNQDDIDLYERSKVKKITLNMLSNLAIDHKLFKLSSFYNIIVSDDLHNKDDFSSIKLLFHICEFIDKVKMIITLFDEIITDHQMYNIVKFDDYFKFFYSEHSNKVQVDLKLKDLAYFYYFVLTSNLFKMHPDERKNRKLLMEFFMKNFMYTDAKGNPTHFKNFIKEISHLTTENSKFQDKFVEGLIFKLNQFKSVDLFKLERSL